MSSPKGKEGPKGVHNVERRTWDKELYEQRAKDRLDRGDDYVDQKAGLPSRRSRLEEFQEAPVGAAGPEGSARAYLKSRTAKVDLESRLGKTQVITSTAAPSQQGGWWCETCKCLLKDSANYLDHINGKKHQRALGFSMRVERVDVSKVRDRFSVLKNRQEEAELGANKKRNHQEEYEDRVREAEEEEELRKRQRREEKAAKKKAVVAADSSLGLGDPDMAAMMGFGGFGGSSKV